MSNTAGFDAWARGFAEHWMSHLPQSATRTQYFQGEKQDALDRQLGMENVYGGVFGVQAADAMAARARTGLDELARFDRAALSPVQRTSAIVLERRMQDAIARAEFAQHDFIFNSFVGLHLSLVMFLSSIHPVRNARDAENYLARLTQVAPRLDEGIQEASAAARNGFVPPRFILTRAIEQLDSLSGCAPERHPLVDTFARRLAEVSALNQDERTRFQSAAAAEVGGSIIPAFKRVRELLAAQLPQATDDAGAWRLPDGAAYYAQALRAVSGTQLSPREIHEIGLREVARLENAMDALLTQLEIPAGPMPQRVVALNERLSAQNKTVTREEILVQLQEIVDDAQRRSTQAFDLRPSSPVVVRREPAFSETSAAAHYTPPAPDGSRPGIYWAPLADLGPNVMWLGVGTKTTCYHEAIPGHHFQIALQLELEELPRFRKYDAFGFDIAYVEGWALYAEHFCDEQGWYDGDLPSRIGYLEAQLFRARRLVVDTGLHAFKWTREQAIAYGFTEAEIDRYVVWPGQATAYMLGFLQILESRERAKRALGDGFSITEFHNTVLRMGSVPVDVLAAELDRWSQGEG